jgi:uncharacterized protein (TIGR02117 family)
MRCRRFVCACLALIVQFAACSAPSVDATPGDAVIYIVQRDWHTDIGLPVDEIAGPLATLEKSFPGVRFLTFGFGERQFLVDRRKTFGGMLSALLPSRSALLMTALSATPDQAFGSDHVVTLRVSRAGLAGIETAIWQELEPSATGEPAILADGPYPGSVFYAARDTYDAVFTCNTWTAEMLRAGGLPMPAAGVLFAGQVMGMVRWIGARQASTVPGVGNQVSDVDAELPGAGDRPLPLPLEGRP